MAPNALSRLRFARNISAVDLAAQAGVTRQAIHAIEAGTYVPNTMVALRLAKVLQSTVEELFSLPEDESPPGRDIGATLLPGSAKLLPGQPVKLCRVGKRSVALPPEPMEWRLPPSDAVVSSSSRSGRTQFRAATQSAGSGNRILLAGCDPSISLLAERLRTAGVDLVIAHRNSSQALALLKQQFVHVAGTHLRDSTSGDCNLPAIGRLFTKGSLAVFSYSNWQQGIVVRPGNPKGIRKMEDLARPGVIMMNREPGSGTRLLLDEELQRIGLSAEAIEGYNNIAYGHVPAAWQVRSGVADCCLATGAAARLLGLGFIPLVIERYDLAIRLRDLPLPGIQTMVDELTRLAFRRDLELVTGYDSSVGGVRRL